MELEAVSQKHKIEIAEQADFLDLRDGLAVED